MAFHRKRQNKYGNKITIVDGVRFQSVAEAKRYGELKLLEKAGKISRLELQPRFPLKVLDQLICTYVADFEYVDSKTARTVTEDCKGFPTPLYRIKKKLMKAIHGIDITEIQA